MFVVGVPLPVRFAFDSNRLFGLVEFLGLVGAAMRSPCMFAAGILGERGVTVVKGEAREEWRVG